jgi:hypothetical protein
MIFKQNKIQALALFILSLLSIVLLTVVFWNSLLKASAGISTLPIILLAIALIAVSWLYIIYLKETDADLINSKINKKIEEERSKILADFSKKEEVIDDKKVDLDALLGKILPKGNFKNIDSFISKLLQNLAPEIEMSQGIFYMLDKENGTYEFLTGYALTKKEIPGFKAGENLNGQVAISKEIMVIHDIPEEYIIESGLGKGKPVHLVLAPIISENESIAILELATFRSNTDYISDILNKIMLQVSDKLVQMIKS